MAGTSPAMTRLIPTAIILDLSCSAKAEHPVTTASAVLAQSDTATCLATGSSAFADEDGEMSRRLEHDDFRLAGLHRHCEPTGPARSGRPDDRLREAIQKRRTRSGLLRRFAPRNDEAVNQPKRIPL